MWGEYGGGTRLTGGRRGEGAGLGGRKWQKLPQTVGRRAGFEVGDGRKGLSGHGTSGCGGRRGGLRRRFRRGNGVRGGLAGRDDGPGHLALVHPAVDLLTGPNPERHAGDRHAPAADDQLGDVAVAVNGGGQQAQEAVGLDAAHTARLKNICVRLPTLEGWLDVYAAAFRTYSEELYAGGDIAAALAILSAGIDHLREQEIEGIPSVLIAQRALLLALSGDAAAAGAELAALPASDLDPNARADHPWRVAEAFTEALSTIALTHGERSAPSDLVWAIGRAATTGNVRSEIRFRRLLAAFPGSSSPSAEHAADLGRLRELEERSGFRRSAVLYGPGGKPHADMADPNRKLTPPTIGLRREFFSERELDVIARLERGLSDKGIAMDLGITAHGVRYHLKRIYAKLHARDRDEARAKAGRLGLL